MCRPSEGHNEEIRKLITARGVAKEREANKNALKAVRAIERSLEAGVRILSSGQTTNEMLHNKAVKPLETQLKDLESECAELELSGDDDDTRMQLANIQKSILVKRTAQK